MSTESRIEHDAIGEIQVPLHALHGAQTERALRNFQLSGTTISKIRFLLPAFAQVKCAAAMVNKRTGAISSEIADAIIAATDQIVAGRCDHAFEVDALQGGAGTSTNMNMNEVLANLAAIQVGTSPGRYDVVHPNDHVNRNQSTNDAYPTAMRIALFRSTGELLERLGCLCDAFEGRRPNYLWRGNGCVCARDTNGGFKVRRCAPATAGGPHGWNCDWNRSWSGN